MSVPEPLTPLDNSCSVIHNNTFYSFSPQGFESLLLEKGAKWKKLVMGEKVVGATCVDASTIDPSQAGLFVVGGKSDSTAFPGLQKFTYSTGNWTTITLPDLVTQDRQWHGSTYIQADDVILIYGGSQTGVRGLSSQTFTIQASEPFEVKGYESNAAPATSPVVFSWSAADAAMMSGDGVNGKIYWFNPTTGWRDSGASLARPVQKEGGSMDAILVTGSDGSKSLFSFDFAQSPNRVSRALVQDASGKPILASPPITKRTPIDETLEQPGLTMDDWPSYNATNAPQATRQNFAMAQSPSGMVVFSGGNAKEPMAIFDADLNSWLDPVEIFVGPKATSTPSHSPTASATHQFSDEPTFLSVPPMQTSDSDQSLGLTPNTILGITLGVISGVLVLLGLILFMWRTRQRRRRQNYLQALHPKREDGPSAVEKKIGRPVMIQNLASPSPDYFPGHSHQRSQDSVSSMAILMGRVGKTGKTAMEPDQLKSTISKPILQVKPNPLLQVEDDRGVITAAVVPEVQSATREVTQPATRRSSGWNRYWSGASALNILGFGASKGTAVPSGPTSWYTPGPDKHEAHDQNAVPASLTIEGRPELSIVNSKSPVLSTYPNGVPPWQEGMSGRIEGSRPFSQASSGYSSGIPESVHEAWDPMSAEKPWGADRAPSSVYAASIGGTLVPARLGVSKQPQLAMATTSTDMSWLNLGDDSHNR